MSTSRFALRSFSRLPGLLVFAVLLAVSSELIAREPVGWRTNGTGVYEAKSPPTHWSTRDNVVWSAELPSRSNAQPVIVGDRIFVCAEPFQLLCLDAKDGRILWQRNNDYRSLVGQQQWAEIQKQLDAARQLDEQRRQLQQQVDELEKLADRTRQQNNQILQLHQQLAQVDQTLRQLPLARKYTVPKTQPQYNGYTTATPTSDGQHVWALLGNCTVVCYDMTGERKWAEVLPDQPHGMWGHSSSPLLLDDRLIVCIEDIVALDKLTGRQIWRTRYGQTWGSPVRAKVGDEELILMANGRIVRASDGRILTRVAGLDRASPIAIGRIVYYVGIGADAFVLPQQVKEPFELKELWSTETRGGEFYASAVVHDGLVYATSTRGILNVIDAVTGQGVYVQRLRLGSGPVWPSLVVAGDLLYVSSRDGTTLVLRTGRKYEEVARNQLEYFIATPVFDNDRLYIRTSERLYCIGS